MILKELIDEALLPGFYARRFKLIVYHHTRYVFTRKGKVIAEFTKKKGWIKTVDCLPAHNTDTPREALAAWKHLRAKLCHSLEGYIA